MRSSSVNHLAIIMDGNARWALKFGLSASEGHKSGAENAKKILQEVSKLGISYLTFYAFSTENWNRSDDEVEFLLELFSIYIESEKPNLMQNGIRLKIIGDLKQLDPLLQQKIAHITEITAHNNKLTLCIAFSYGGRVEIIDACQKVIDNGILHVTTEVFQKFLYDPLMPDVDLLIRTSGVYRLSNFLLWHLAYAELYFTEKYWPEFDESDLKSAILEYEKRVRNFGTRKSGERSRMKNGW